MVQRDMCDDLVVAAVDLDGSPFPVQMDYVAMVSQGFLEAARRFIRDQYECS